MDPRAPPRWLQDRPRRLQAGSHGLQNRSKGPREPFLEASKSPRPSKKRPRGAKELSNNSQELSKSPPRTLKYQTARLELGVHKVGSAGTATRKQSAAHLPVCIGVLDHDPRHCGPDNGSQIPLGMLPLPSPSPLATADPMQVHAGPCMSMQFPCNIFGQDGSKSAQDAFKMVQDPSKRSQGALKTLQEPFKLPKMQFRGIIS